MDECDFYADVDFGHGPVELRCTMKGSHMIHMCHVVFGTDTSKFDQNIFDPRETIEGLREITRQEDRHATNPQGWGQSRARRL